MISLETVPDLQQYAGLFRSLEWCITGLFTLEYVLRLACVRNPWRYAFSFWGLIDLFSFLPTYIAYFGEAGLGSFAMLRAIRLLRVFRILKLLRLMTEADELARSIWYSRDKILVFLFVVIIAVTLSGTLMYQVENGADENSSFSSIPQSMYWAIVTMSTVGYGDVVPKTAIGKTISAMLILLGYSMIIVPTGVVTAKLSEVSSSSSKSDPSSTESPEERSCKECGYSIHSEAARFCCVCGARLTP